ncbi:MAG TPA: hypothetical protein EYQ31_16925, partial [Candidatus Handelsmanbacteria bacterium]|nr:hypothetical protein [Candidatus Handelsmanbacteria bacterium]
MLTPQFGELRMMETGQIADLGAIKVVVIHTQRGIYVDTETVAMFDQRCLWIFTALRHATDIFAVVVAGRIFVGAVIERAYLFQCIGLPAGCMFAHTPEQGTHLGVSHRCVGDLKKLFEGLARGRISMGCAIPIVDNAIIRW